MVQRETSYRSKYYKACFQPANDATSKIHMTPCVKVNSLYTLANGDKK